MLDRFGSDFGRWPAHQADPAKKLLIHSEGARRSYDAMLRVEALIDACHKRARPIVMTTVAMMAGMLPTALGLGQGASFRQPMAIAVIGGLISSTALSLVLVPVVYEFVDGFEQWLRPKLGRFVTQKTPEDDAPIKDGEERDDLDAKPLTGE